MDEENKVDVPAGEGEPAPAPENATPSENAPAEPEVPTE